MKFLWCILFIPIKYIVENEKNVTIAPVKKVLNRIVQNLRNEEHQKSLITKEKSIKQGSNALSL